MDENLKKMQEEAEMTDEALDGVSGGAPTAYLKMFTSEWCPYCRKQHQVQKGDSTTITVMTYKLETVPVMRYFCLANIGDGVIISRPPRAFFVEDAGGVKYYFDDNYISIKQ